MKGVTFYAEYNDKARKQPTGNAVAVERQYSRWDSFAASLVYEGVAGVFNHGNSHVASAGIAQTFLDTYCRKIGEAEARRLHPRLFEYLDEVYSAA